MPFAHIVEHKSAAAAVKLAVDKLLLGFKARSARPVLILLQFIYAYLQVHNDTANPMAPEEEGMATAAHAELFDPDNLLGKPLQSLTDPKLCSNCTILLSFCCLS